MDLTQVVDDLVHEPTQTEGAGLDLTVGSVFRVTDAGRVDFGGGELEPAEVERVPTETRDDGDDYGWWHLTADVYLLEYNETLAAPADAELLLQTRDAVRVRGAFHPTRRLAGDDSFGRVPLAVGDGGIRLKENARVSSLLSV